MTFAFPSSRRVLGALAAGAMLAATIAPALALPVAGAPALGLDRGDIVMAQAAPPKHAHPVHPGGPGAGPGQHGGHFGGGGGGGHWQGGQWIVPGLALGILGAAAAAATYGQPPQPGMCWYYNDPSQQSGFWDYCH
jgi:hypothetical protein